MPETPELFNELANLRDQVDDMSRSVSALARKSGMKEDILAAMNADGVMAQVFLLVDGRRTQKEIADALRQTGGAGASQPTVSRKLDVLTQDWDLIRPTQRTTAGIRYVHTSLAKDLRIARALERKRPGAKKAP